MYHMHMLTLLPPSKQGERYGCRLGCSIYVGDDALLASESPSPHHLLAAFDASEPVLKLRRHGDAGWVEHRYGDGGWQVTDVGAFEGLLYGVTADGEVAAVELWPEVEVTLLETESYEDGQGGEEAGLAVTRHHLFDVQTEDVVDVLMLRTRGGRIEALGCCG